MKQIKVIIFLIFLAIPVSAQNSLPVNSEFERTASIKKAAQIISQARNAISKKIKIADVKSLTLNAKSSEQLSVAGNTINGTTEEEFNFTLPDKIRHKFSGNYSTNQSLTLAVLNGEKFSSKIDTFVDGKLTNYNFGAMINRKELISQLKHDAFINFFPVMLDSSWYLPLEFTYVGIAEAKADKATVIEAILPNKVRYQMFFDINTDLLILMTESWTNKENKKNELKYFFSDYQEKDGLLIATRIITERNGEVTKEKEIKNIKINPVFKAEVFEVKEK